MTMKVVGGLVTASMLLSGCATVRSTPRDVNDLAQGVTYYLPKKEIKFSAERKLLKKDELEKAIATKKAELDATETAIKTATAALKAAQARANNLAVQNDPQAKAQVAKDIALATADVEISTKKKGDVEEELKRLQAGLLAITAASPSDCAFQYSATLELLAAVADTRIRLLANSFHSPLRDDDTKIAVTADGLLSSANAVAADRTGDIIVEIASAIAGGGVGPAGLSTDTAGFVGSGSLKCEQLPTKFVMQFDPADGAKAINAELVSAEYPFQLQLPPMEDRLVITDPHNDVILDRARRVGRPVKPGTKEYRLLEALHYRGMDGALFYRSRLPQAVVIRQCKASLTCTNDPRESVPIDGATVMIPQIGPISYIPMTSSAFVKTVDDVVFENGMLTSWSSTRPSELLEVVRLPVKLMKAVISVPAELIKLRVDLSDQQKGLAASQQAQIAADAKLKAINKCVKDAGENDRIALACYSQ